MRNRFPFVLLCCGFCVSAFSFSAAAAQCIPFTEAAAHIGETRCVTGKVFHVEHAARGVTLLNFCEAPQCSFAGVIFARELNSVGDVRGLPGRTVELHGKVKEYDGHAEIIIERARQIGGDGVRLPALPKTYDVEQKGHYSAGTFSLPRPTHAKAKKKQTPTSPVQFPDDPE